MFQLETVVVEVVTEATLKHKAAATTTKYKSNNSSQKDPSPWSLMLQRSTIFQQNCYLHVKLRYSCQNQKTTHRFVGEQCQYKHQSLSPKNKFSQKTTQQLHNICTKSSIFYVTVYSSVGRGVRFKERCIEAKSAPIETAKKSVRDKESASMG